LAFDLCRIRWNVILFASGSGLDSLHFFFIVRVGSILTTSFPKSSILLGEEKAKANFAVGLLLPRLPDKPRSYVFPARLHPASDGQSRRFCSGSLPSRNSVE